MQGDCVRGTSPEAWDFHGALAARNREAVSCFGLVSLLDLNDKLLIDPIGAGPAQSEGIPANLAHREVSQIWNLLCIRTESCWVTTKGNGKLGCRWDGILDMVGMSCPASIDTDAWFTAGVEHTLIVGTKARVFLFSLWECKIVLGIVHNFYSWHINGTIGSLLLCF